MRPVQRFFTVLSPLALMIFGGTIFFHRVEGWNYVDSYFFSVVTLSTVGYGNLVPVTPLGKIATSIFIFVGLGIYALAVQQFAEYLMHRREKRTGEASDELESGSPSPVGNRADDPFDQSGPRE